MNSTHTKNLAGQVCLITGGTRGIGRAISSMLLAEGASVVLCGRSQEAVNQAVEELRAEKTREWGEQASGKVEGKAADVRDYDQVVELFRFVDECFGSGLDVLVNNAGVGLFRPVSEIRVDEWKFILETNLFGAFYATQQALPRFKTRGGGYIVNMSSLAGSNAFAGGAAYNASKFALTGFSEATMQDLRQENVRVSYVMPGSVATGFGGREENEGSDWRIWPEDVADVVRMCLLMPARTLVSRIEMRPSRPQQSVSKR
jgi:3-oxoacyl-[acyl-carrier protein] reductase